MTPRPEIWVGWGLCSQAMWLLKRNHRRCYSSCLDFFFFRMLILRVQILRCEEIQISPLWVATGRFSANRRAEVLVNNQHPWPNMWVKLPLRDSGSKELSRLQPSSLSSWGCKYLGAETAKCTLLCLNSWPKEPVHDIIVLLYASKFWVVCYVAVGIGTAPI